MIGYLDQLPVAGCTKSDETMTMIDVFLFNVVHCGYHEGKAFLLIDTYMFRFYIREYCMNCASCTDLIECSSCLVVLCSLLDLPLVVYVDGSGSCCSYTPT